MRSVPTAPASCCSDPGAMHRQGLLLGSHVARCMVLPPWITPGETVHVPLLEGMQIMPSHSLSDAVTFAPCDLPGLGSYSGFYCD